MLPSSSLTVPDMQISRVRFFMEELCSNLIGKCIKIRLGWVQTATPLPTTRERNLEVLGRNLREDS